MTRVEIGIIVVAALIPIIALVILFPFKKLFKKKGKVVKPAKVAEVKVVEESTPAPVPAQPEYQGITTASLDHDEFLSFLQDKSITVKKPERKEIDFNPGEFNDDIFSLDFVNKNKKVKKTVVQEFQDLSPELKALILSGVLDRRDY